jgi:hypothetical protein
MRALVIRNEPINQILKGTKTWEMRGTPCKIREQVGLIESGTGTVIGVCNVIDCIGPLTPEQWKRNARKAGMRPSDSTGYTNTYAWVLEKPRRLKRPVPYVHPYGAIVWVKLDPSVERKVKAQLK